jgi:putative nucleotidyltransferase with HDIG domain
MVKSLALSIGVIKSLSKGKSSPYFSHKDLWLHSLTVATGMKNLGKRYCSRSDSEHLFVIGLLHDMGKLVLEQFFNKAFREIMDRASESNTPLFLAEKRMLGFDHGEIGAMVLRRWNFPDGIVVPIDVHHQGGLPKGRVPNVIAILRIADALSLSIERSEDANLSMKVQEDDMKALSLEGDALERARKELECSKEGIEALFSVVM